MMIINSDDGFFEIELEMQGETDFMHFKSADYESIIRKLDDTIERFI